MECRHSTAWLASISAGLPRLRLDSACYVVALAVRHWRCGATLVQITRCGSLQNEGKSENSLYHFTIEVRPLAGRTCVDSYRCVNRS